ncbi:hypothetical protein [Pseudoflavonifractor phocaeensis]|uniref:hypothetical protein n=1 Tax=Pseudoflavonifractor phocaeensis TaxID=1870988 RepID=UPI001958AAEC|nr:hypothetical protein [Pseudoflavonifractor phocaeensis]MBM6924479.1 hypothetical protein [Pseudoflavonifractor phocaeensis]
MRYNNVCGINRKSVYSRGGSRAIPEKRLKGAAFLKFSHCYNAPGQSHLALKALAFKACDFVQYAL